MIDLFDLGSFTHSETILTLPPLRCTFVSPPGPQNWHWWMITLCFANTDSRSCFSTSQMFEVKDCQLNMPVEMLTKNRTLLLDSFLLCFWVTRDVCI
uniref:Uncharacterized protein n=1 Tax=Anguilla anguilla TaxID=7936 RepID=A0A0E9WEP5_ANGAN